MRGLFVGLIVAIGVSLFATETPAQADRVLNPDYWGSNEMLSDNCKELERKDPDALQVRGQAYCLGYLTGVRRTLDLMQTMAEIERLSTQRVPVFLCIPAEVSTDLLVRVYLKWVENHPEKLHEPLALGVWEAFTEVWKCKSE